MITKFKKKDTSKKSLFDISDVEQMAVDYHSVSETIKALTSKKSSLSDTLKKCAMDLGNKDDKGSYYVGAGSYEVGAVCKHSIKLNSEKAIAFCNKRGFSNVIKKRVVEEIDEEALTTLFNDGEITEEELKSLTDEKIDYSVSVKLKEEMPAVEQIAASRKKR